MATATVHIAEVGGFAGRARTYRLSPQYEGYDYVTIWEQPGFGAYQRPEVGVVPATETGAPAEMSMMRRPGSHVLHDAIATDAQMDDACSAALSMLGGYMVTP